jgi:hypothetical protein
MCIAALIGWDPAIRPSPLPRIWTRNSRALLVSKDRRHLLVTPWVHRIAYSVFVVVWSGEFSCTYIIVLLLLVLYYWNTDWKNISMISKQKHKHFDIEAYFRNKNKTLWFSPLVMGTKAERFSLFQNCLKSKRNVLVIFKSLKTTPILSLDAGKI